MTQTSTRRPQSLVTWTVRYRRTDGPAWTTAGTELTKASATELADALRGQRHILAASVTSRVAVGAHGSLNGVAVHPGADQATCPLCVAYAATYGDC